MCRAHWRNNLIARIKTRNNNTHNSVQSINAERSWCIYRCRQAGISIEIKSLQKNQLSIQHITLTTITNCIRFDDLHHQFD
ncbi:hypothetical protein D3C72_1870640 [compost metagenome]